MSARVWFMAGAVVAFAAHAAAQDVAHVAGDRPGDPPARRAGVILDYTGRELTLQVGTIQQTIAGPKVLAVETAWTKEQVEADRLFDERQFAAALDGYMAAGRVERRRWVRRRILAQMIRCQRELGDWGAAGDLFLTLVNDDPDTPYFDTIPLAWLSSEVSPTLVAKSEAWLARADSPVAVLMGASHLIGGGRASVAEPRLDTLARNADPRIAALAQAQAWRASLARVTPERLAGWSQRVVDFPETLRAGPYFVLGRANAQLGRHSPAAIDYLRVPILYRGERRVEAEALFGAAQSLEQLGQRREAARVFQELVDKHPDASVAQLARERIDALDGGGS